MDESILELLYELRKNPVTSKRISDTGIGKTLEDEFQIKENNKIDSDIKGYELKAKRFESDSKITLFTKAPKRDIKGSANAYLRDKYGRVDPDNAIIKTLHASFYTTKYNKYDNKYGFKLIVDDLQKKIILSIKEYATGVIDETVYYPYEDILKATNKLKNLFVVYADVEKKDDKEVFKYHKAQFYLDFKIDAFYKLLKEGKVQYDIRLGTYKTGKSKGKLHDHGSGFRVDRYILPYLYERSFSIL